MMFVDFSDYGVDDYWYPVDQDELLAVGAGAQRMIEQYREATCELMLTSWEIGLRNRARELEGFVDDDWFIRALLCIALRGYRGDSAPRFHDVRNFQ